MRARVMVMLFLGALCFGCSSDRVGADEMSQETIVPAKQAANFAFPAQVGEFHGSPLGDEAIYYIYSSDDSSRGELMAAVMTGVTMTQAKVSLSEGRPVGEPAFCGRSSDLPTCLVGLDGAVVLINANTTWSIDDLGGFANAFYLALP